MLGTERGEAAGEPGGARWGGHWGPGPWCWPDAQSDGSHWRGLCRQWPNPVPIPKRSLTAAWETSGKNQQSLVVSPQARSAWAPVGQTSSLILPYLGWATAGSRTLSTAWLCPSAHSCLQGGFWALRARQPRGREGTLLTVREPWWGQLRSRIADKLYKKQGDILFLQL